MTKKCNEFRNVDVLEIKFKNPIFIKKINENDQSWILLDIELKSKNNDLWKIIIFFISKLKEKYLDNLNSLKFIIKL